MKETILDDTVDVAVIGAGPAGLAAACSAKEAGAQRVVIIERASELGGLLHQCVHNGFGLFYFEEDLTGPEYAHRFIEKVRDLGVELMLDTMVVGLSNKQEVTASSAFGFSKFTPRSLVLCMGCRERARGSIGIPGTRPAGILTAGTAQRFVNVEGYLPGKKVFILGSGDIGMIMARRLSLEGAEVLAVAEILPYTGGLIRNEVQCVHDFDIPLLLSHTVTEIHGEGHIKGVTISKVDDVKKPIVGTEKYYECDSLLLSVGLIPENELSIMAGIEIDPVTRGPYVDNHRMTSNQGIFAGGNVVHVHDLVDNVTIESEIAGRCAAQFASNGKTDVSDMITIGRKGNVNYVVPQKIAKTDLSSGEINISLRVREPKEKAKIIIGEEVIKTYKVVRPSEMITIEFSSDELLRLKDKPEIIVEGL
jgi:NADPH-dependent 2,4-dienoyl-CoA reductase/sulfur reductase-like enzyme